MAIPSGTGTEVLKRTSITGIGASTTQTAWWHADFDVAQITSQSTSHTVDSNHIITVLNIVICNTVDGTGYTFDIGVHPSGGSMQQLLNSQLIDGGSTFVWNDRIVLSSGDALAFRSDEASSGDSFAVYISFIEQDWS